MKDKQKRTLLSVGLIGLAALVLFSLTAGGGNLEPTSAPGPTMHTLEQLYNLTSSLSVSSGQLTGPVAGAKARSLAYMDVNVPDIEGESTDASHSGWIELLAVHHSAQQPAATSRSSVGGRIGRRAQFSDITLVKEIDKATPKLALYCAKGDHIPDLVIEFTMVEPVTSNTVVYKRVELEDVIVSAFTPVMSYRSNDEFTHLEEVSFRYGKIQWTYIPYDSMGNPGTPIITGWDQTVSKEL
ncbi:MAG: Hcp family type VI secretion system effector [Planctomycetota bacterium]|jgi:type VI secretion system secreted protein Hcp